MCIRDSSWGIDLQTEHERFLTEEHFKRPTFVTDYPAEIKAFYMRMNDDGKTVAAADCLVPGIGEGTLHTRRHMGDIAECRCLLKRINLLLAGIEMCIRDRS